MSFKKSFSEFMESFKSNEFRKHAKGAIISGLITAFFMFLLIYRGYQSVIAGICIGVFTYSGIAAYTGLIVRQYLRKTNLFIVLVLNSVVQILIILIVSWFFVGIFYMGGDWGYMSGNFSRLMNSYFVLGTIFGLMMSIFFTFYFIITTLVGKNILGKLFLGLYRNPFETERIFMFLDINDSTTIAEKIGHVKFLSLVNDFFYDLTDSVSRTRGEIYKYVGDEVIITWKTAEALDQANCISCFFMIGETIKKRSDYYQKKFGLVPSFKAALHGGLSVTGELGYTKREIAYMGDVVNTTARIVESCKTYGKKLLVSEYIAGKLEPTGNLLLVEVARVKLRGKENELKLYAVERI